MTDEKAPWIVDMEMSRETDFTEILEKSLAKVVGFMAIRMRVEDAYELPAAVEAVTKKSETFTAFKALVEEAAGLRIKYALPGPQRLTVKKADGSFSVKSHIGGEQFILRDVYQGKTKGWIGVFIPVEASGYHSMEMPLVDACKTFGRPFSAAIAALALSVPVEKTEVAAGTPDKLDEQRTKDYGDFGSW
jgi:hypothetical protein